MLGTVFSGEETNSTKIEKFNESFLGHSLSEG
jgi:hypothetical protein